MDVLYDLAMNSVTLCPFIVSGEIVTRYTLSNLKREFNPHDQYMCNLYSTVSHAYRNQKCNLPRTLPSASIPVARSLVYFMVLFI